LVVDLAVAVVAAALVEGLAGTRMVAALVGVPLVAALVAAVQRPMHLPAATALGTPGAAPAALLMLVPLPAATPLARG
jgi:hypothetical protein